MKSILSLPPALQAVWTAVYAAVDSLEYTDFDTAEERAWEAVRRANGGEMPEEPRETDDKTWKRSAMRDALLWFADEGHYEGTYRHGAGFVDAVGIEKAREALGIPVERHDGGLMPLAEALTHDAVIGADVDEPTNEEMIEALAPIVARAGRGPDWDQLPAGTQDMRRLHATAEVARCESVMARAAVAAWKAARAWGRK